MREYIHKIYGDDDITAVSEKDSTETVRTEYYFHCDDTCYWAKKVDGKLHYSRDEVFSTEKLDATHFITFMK